MTKEMESPTRGQMAEVYRLAVILVICVIGEKKEPQLDEGTRGLRL